MKSAFVVRYLAFSVVTAASLTMLLAWCPLACAEETGACCDPSTGSCQVLTQSDCNSQHGAWLGPGTNCNPNPCPPCLNTLCEGSCCLPDGSCLYCFGVTCDQYNGTFTNNGTCWPNPCMTSSVPAPPQTRHSWGKIKSRYR